MKHNCALHRAPVRCKEKIPTDRLMCFGHWKMVPKPLQNAVWDSWKERLKTGEATAHEAAKEAATKAVEAKLADKPKRLVIRALTLYQPWAWAVAHGKKVIENRNWQPYEWLLQEDVEAWIAIHAGATYDPDGEDFLRSKGVTLPRDASKLKGHILGIGRLVDCVTKSTDPMFFGPYGWVFKDLKALDAPYKIQGAQGLWEVPEDCDKLLRALLQSDPRQGNLFGGAK